jgi:hypothetical protein
MKNASRETETCSKEAEEFSFRCASAAVVRTPWNQLGIERGKTSVKIEKSFGDCQKVLSFHPVRNRLSQSAADFQRKIRKILINIYDENSLRRFDSHAFSEQENSVKSF